MGSKWSSARKIYPLLECARTNFGTARRVWIKCSYEILKSVRILCSPHQYKAGFPLGGFFRAKRFFSPQKIRASAFVFSTTRTSAIISINFYLIDCVSKFYWKMAAALSLSYFLLLLLLVTIYYHNDVKFDCRSQGRVLSVGEGTEAARCRIFLRVLS